MSAIERVHHKGTKDTKNIESEHHAFDAVAREWNIEVDAVAAVEFHPLVDDRQRDLPTKHNRMLSKLKRKAILISRFEWVRSEMPMHFDSQAY
jgi:hypothetical protein